ncbi:MAG: thioesterase [Williamsia sp.]|nr:thioesterase [Williamsia sp.]
MTKPLNLFCLPFAGGNSYSYRQYAEKASSYLNVFPVDYPGHGTRMHEPLIEDIRVLVHDMYLQISPKIGRTDYAIYGHSLGGLVGYLVTRELLKNNHKAPLHLFITGTSGPAALSRTDKKRHLLPRDEFLAEIKRYGGMPDEILDNDEWMDFFEPILRADFKVSENYIYGNDPPLKIPITVITGSEEDIETADISIWQKETNCTIDFKQLPGNHFFIFDYPHTIIEIIYKKLFTHAPAYQL